MSQQKRFRQKNRREGPSFIQIPHFVLESEQWGNLPGNAVKLLMELASQYKGGNNGDLSATETMLKARGFASPATLWKFLHLLEEQGWIVKTRQGGRFLGCNLYAVTWWPVNACDKHEHPEELKPSHAWKNNLLLQKMKSEATDSVVRRLQTTKTVGRGRPVQSRSVARPKSRTTKTVDLSTI